MSRALHTWQITDRPEGHVRVLASGAGKRSYRVVWREDGTQRETHHPPRLVHDSAPFPHDTCLVEQNRCSPGCTPFNTCAPTIFRAP